MFKLEPHNRRIDRRLNENTLGLAGLGGSPSNSSKVLAIGQRIWRVIIQEYLDGLIRLTRRHRKTAIPGRVLRFMSRIVIPSLGGNGEWEYIRIPSGESCE